MRLVACAVHQLAWSCDLCVGRVPVCPCTIIIAMPHSLQHSTLPWRRLQSQVVRPDVYNLQVRRARVGARVSSAAHRPSHDQLRNDHAPQMHWSKRFRPGTPAGYINPDVHKQPRQPQVSRASEPLRKVRPPCNSNTFHIFDE